MAYVTMINTDDSRDEEYKFVVSYLEALLQNYEGEILVRFVHLPANWKIAAKSAKRLGQGPKCVTDRIDYVVTQVDAAIIADLRRGDDNSFNRFFNGIYTDGTYKCDAYAVKALYADFNAFRASFNGEITAVKISVQPFSDPAAEYDQVEFRAIQDSCNNDLFVDSTLLITDAQYANRGNTWESVLSNQETGLMSCLLSDSQVGKSTCSNYEVLNQKENILNRIGRERTTCPMIPNWERRGGKPQMTQFSSAIGRLMATSITSTIDSRGPRPDAPSRPEQPIIINNLPKGNLTIPEGVICSYDIMIAIDLACIDFEENPVVTTFAKGLISDIFGAVGRDRLQNERVLRIGVVGFHSEVVIAMNFFEMSTYQGIDINLSTNRSSKAVVYMI